MQGLGFAILGALRRLTRTGEFARPRYCGRCGEEFVERSWYDGYSRRDGTRVVHRRRACPNVRRPDLWDDDECFPPLSYPDERA